MLAGFLARCVFPGALKMDVWALPAAAPVLAQAGIAVRQFPEFVRQSELERHWTERPARALVTATSHYEPFESTLWRIARERACPSLALLDSWSNLPRRFAQARPDYLGAIDERQASELMQLGFLKSQILTVGHLWLGALRSNNGVRAAVPRTPKGVTRVLFVSERIAGDVAGGQNEPYGFDEFDSFRVLHRAANSAARAGTRVSLTVKFHPYEEPAPFLQRARSLTQIIGVDLRYVSGGDDPYPWVLWSDLVVGIGSTLLLEAMLLGKPVISVQPGLRREDTFAASRMGLAQTITDPREAEDRLARLIQNKHERSATRALHKPFRKEISANGVPIWHWIRANVGA